MAGSSSVFKVPPLPPVFQPKEVEISRPLWNKFLRESLCALYTPFVVGLASGNLTVKGFRHYISQNFHFLTASVRALEMLEGYAVADDDKTKLVELRRSVLNELKDFDKEWSREIVNEHPINPATEKYTDFLLATASGEIDGVNAVVLDKSKIIRYTLGVKVARLRLFAFFFNEIQALLNATDSDNPYKEQIDNSLTNFKASAGNTEDLLDKLSAGLTKDEHNMIEKLYHQAIKLQIEFLSVHLEVKHETVIPLCKHLDPAEWRLLLSSGFEMTCTAVDSYASLIEISILSAAMAKKNKPDKEGRISRKSYAECQKECDAIRREYKDKYLKLINETVLKSAKVEQYSHERLSEALKVLSTFEENALENAISSRFLKGIKRADVQNAGERLILRDGCWSFLRELAQNEKVDVNVHVLSSCWCQDLIISAFSSGLVDVNVQANELIYNDKGISKGRVIIDIESGHDKLSALEALDMKDFEDGKAQFTVYIGSSVGDLLCLLRADIGIVIGSCPILRKVGRHFGVFFEPLLEGIVRKQKDEEEASLDWEEPAGTLYIVHCWAEIQAFILGFS